MSYFQNSDVTYWTMLALGIAIVGAFAAAKIMGPEKVWHVRERLHSMWDSDFWSRIFGLLLILVSVYLFWALLVVPVQNTIRAGGKLVLVSMSGIVLLSITIQIGLIALICGSRKSRFLMGGRDERRTSLQSTTGAVMIGIGFLVLFVFAHHFGLRPGR